MNVLVTPLDWGLGHATRCVPLVREIEKLDHHVMIAGSGASLDLLRIEFPGNKFFEIPSYGISYNTRLPLTVHLILQAPSIISTIKKEKRQVSKIISDQKIDFVISDNRYGCYDERIPSAIITHQLSIQTPLNAIANRYNKRLISRFNECWVPDTPDHALSGQLSISNIPHKFIGPLSRMRRITTATQPYNILGLISGPEPHRTSFDVLLTNQLKAYTSCRIVRGLPSGEKTGGPIFNHLPSDQLNELIEAADIVISRPGYSTVMDLAALNKKAIFVPTPGQTEQLYLAKEFDRRRIAPMIAEEKFSLPDALDRVKNYSGFTENYFKENLLERTLREFLD
jgi:uncharacterized protein (TIGR00661 family)